MFSHSYGKFPKKVHEHERGGLGVMEGNQPANKGRPLNLHSFPRLQPGAVRGKRLSG